MAWDSSRPVPWKRLAIEWLVIAIVVGAISFFVSKNHRAANYLTIVIAAPIYIGFGALLAKFGYARKTVKELRAEDAARQAAKAREAATAGSTAPRPKPAPTSRTSAGPSNRPANKKKKR
jgi:hypothetical protein